MGLEHFKTTDSVCVQLKIVNEMYCILYTVAQLNWANAKWKTVSWVWNSFAIMVSTSSRIERRGSELVIWVQPFSSIVCVSLAYFSKTLPNYNIKMIKQALQNWTVFFQSCTNRSPQFSSTYSVSLKEKLLQHSGKHTPIVFYSSY